MCNLTYYNLCVFSVKPHIDREAMKSVTIKVGQNADFDVPVRGEPPPQLVWTFKGKALRTEGKIKVC